MKCGHQQNELEAKIDGNQVMTLNILVTLKMKDDDEMIEFIIHGRGNSMTVL